MGPAWRGTLPIRRLLLASDVLSKSRMPFHFDGGDAPARWSPTAGAEYWLAFRPQSAQFIGARAIHASPSSLEREIRSTSLSFAVGQRSRIQRHHFRPRCFG